MHFLAEECTFLQTYALFLQKHALSCRKMQFSRGTGSRIRNGRVLLGKPSMDQYQFRGKLLTNFQGHWSIQSSPENKEPRDWPIQISLEIHMDQWRPNLSESSGLHRHRSLDCSSLCFHKSFRNGVWGRGCDQAKNRREAPFD